MAIYGIDVCCYQGDIDWAKVKAAGCEFAVLKCIRKDLGYDTAFKSNLKGCNAVKIPVSVYTYVYERSTEGALRRSQAAIRACADNGLKDCVIWWDVEDHSIRSTKAEDRARLTASIKVAKSTIEKAGYKFGVYCDKDFYKSCINANVIGGRFWIASYGENKSTKFGHCPDRNVPEIPYGTLCGWQYCSRGQIAGIKSNVDLNVAYDANAFTNGGIPVDMPTLRLGDNGSAVKALQKILRISVTGKFENGTERAVLQFQGNNGLDKDGVVGKKTWSKLLI